MINTRIHVIFTSSLFLIIAGAYFYMAWSQPIAYIWATYEDLYGEWIQFLGFVVAFVFSVRIARRKQTYRLFFTLLAIACFYVFMEEISWGQRIFGFESPDLFKSNNLQSETNLHNFFTGPFNTDLKTALEYILAVAFVGYGLIYPLCLKLRWRAALWLDKLGLPAPPFYLWPFFVTAAYLELGPFHFNEAEIAEVMIATALAVMTLHYDIVLRENEVPLTDAVVARSLSSKLTVMMAGVVCFIIMGAAVITQLLYSSDAKAARIDNRIENGLDKFASRYGRFDRWDVSVDLYQEIHRRNPGSRSTMRDLARAYRNLGDMEAFELYVNKALAIDLEKYQKNPSRASVLRSMVHSYRLLANQEAAERYLNDAHELGLKRIKEHPSSANAAYSLGRTYDLMGLKAEAHVQYKRAYELKPTRKKFKKRYLKSKY